MHGGQVGRHHQLPYRRGFVLMWNSYNTASPQGISAGVTTIAGANGDQIHAYVARPDGSGPFPGIVAVMHMPGWDEFYQEFARRLANHGYVVISPDLYCREGHGTPDDIAAKGRAGGGGAGDQGPRERSP